MGKRIKNRATTASTKIAHVQSNVESSAQPIQRVRPKIEPKTLQVRPPIRPTMMIPSAGQEAWRVFVRRQPVLLACQDTLIQQVSALGWQIVARDSSRTQELEDEIRYYTNVFNKADHESFDAWLGRGLDDLLTLSFGWGSEVGRYRDGTVAWVSSMDGATCAPTFNYEYPVIQTLPNAGKIIEYPAESVARTYMSPRTEWMFRGWGMAPPEKIYTSAIMMLQGDEYYWKFVTDTPKAGILDLGDMEKESALQWIDSLTDLLGGVDPLKIAAIYETEKPINFIPFLPPPSDAMMEKIMTWYASLAAAGYGINLSEIGLASTSTMAGAIRDDRRSAKTGRGNLIDKVETLINSILPDTLMFTMENRDDEALNNLGRARATSAAAMGQLIKAGVIDRESALAQLKADRLLNSFVQLGEVTPAAAVTLQPNETQAERVEPESQGGLSPIKAKPRLERALNELLPIFYELSRNYNEESVLDASDGMKHAIIESEQYNDKVPLWITAEVLSSPVHRSTIRSHYSVDTFRNTSAYVKLLRMIEGVSAI